MRNFALLISLYILTLSAQPAELIAEENKIIEPHCACFSLYYKFQPTENDTKEVHGMNRGRPPLGGERITKAFLLGPAGGAAGILLALPTAGLATEDAHPLGSIFAFYAIGFILYETGNAYGVYAACSDDEIAGSYMATLGGTLAGSLLAAAMLGFTDASPAMYWTPLVLPSLGGIIGFKLTSRYRVTAGNEDSPATWIYRQTGPGNNPGPHHCQIRQSRYANIINIRF